MFNKVDKNKFYPTYKIMSKVRGHIHPVLPGTAAIPGYLQALGRSENKDDMRLFRGAQRVRGLGTFCFLPSRTKKKKKTEPENLGPMADSY